MEELMEKIKFVSNGVGLYEMHISKDTPDGGFYMNIDDESYNGLVRILSHEFAKPGKSVDKCRFKWAYKGDFYDITFDMVEDYR